MRIEWVALTYKCLGRRALALIALSLLVLMFALTITSGYVLSVYAFYDELVVSRELSGRVIVVSGVSLAPFTSVVRSGAVLSAVSNSPDVQDVVPEILVPAVLNGTGVLVRGVDSDFLRRYIGYEVIEGSDICEGCLTCAWVGSALARALRLGAGDVITINSIFSKYPLILEVEGVLKLPEPYDHEVLVPYALGQLMRGVGRDYASVVLVLLREGAEPRKVLSKLAGARPGEAPEFLERAFIALKYVGREVRTQVFKHAADILMERLGMPRSSLVATAISLALISSVGAYVIGLIPAVLSRGRLSVLHEQGLAKSRIKASILIFGGVTTALGYLAVRACLPALSNLLGAPVLHHPVSLGSDPVLDVGIPAFVFLFYSTGVLAADAG